MMTGLYEYKNPGKCRKLISHLTQSLRAGYYCQNLADTLCNILLLHVSDGENVLNALECSNRAFQAHSKSSEVRYLPTHRDKPTHTHTRFNQSGERQSVACANKEPQLMNIITGSLRPRLHSLCLKLYR